MQNDKTYIKVDHAIKKEIKEELGTSYASISKALDYSRNTKLSEKIRAMAIEKGGTEYIQVEL